MQGYSTIRWCSREVVQNELAVKLGTHVDGFVDKLIEREIGEAHPKAMRAILDSKKDLLRNTAAQATNTFLDLLTPSRMRGSGADNETFSLLRSLVTGYWTPALAQGPYFRTIVDAIVPAAAASKT